MIVNDTIVQASFTIVTYDRKNIFIIQATAVLALATFDNAIWIGLVLCALNCSVQPRQVQPLLLSWKILQMFLYTIMILH
jgi:hypothetical protein